MALLLMYCVTPTHLEALKISQTNLCALKTPTYTLDGGFTLELQISAKLHSFRCQPAPKALSDMPLFHEWSFDTLSCIPGHGEGLRQLSESDYRFYVFANRVL